MKEFLPTDISPLSSQTNEIYQEAHEECKKLLGTAFTHLDLCHYVYSTKEAVDELGLDEELVLELVDDYVAQIIKAVRLFEKHLKVLNCSSVDGEVLDFTPIRELAHKNLGVARNLRIEDAKALLGEIMASSDLEHLALCVKALHICAVQLSPECAQKTLKLIELKSSI